MGNMSNGHLKSSFSCAHHGHRRYFTEQVVDDDCGNDDDDDDDDDDFLLCVLHGHRRLVDDHFSHCAHDGGVPGPSEILDLTQKDVLQMSFTVNDSKTQLFSKIKGCHIMAHKSSKTL